MVNLRLTLKVVDIDSVDKLTSLKNLRDWGFNHMDFIEYGPGWSDVAVRRRFPQNRVGVRTANRNSFLQAGGTPFYRDKTVSEAIEIGKSIWNDWRVIIYDWSEAGGAVVSGHMVIGEGYGLYEIFYGPGIVRDVDKRADVIRARFTYPSQIYDTNVRLVAEKSALLSELAGIGDIVVEFSVFNRPTGLLAEHAIFWEYRQYLD